MGRILIDLIILAIIVTTSIFVYVKYGETIYGTLFGEQNTVIYIGVLALSVSIADEPEEWRQGLSGTESLGELEGKLFVFDESKKHGIWMKDMTFPIDIIWIDEQFRVIHIEEQIDPSTYPDTFAPDSPARFVLEMNSFFVESFKINIGDKLTLPPAIFPPNSSIRL